jgi:hypothetical protein
MKSQKTFATETQRHRDTEKSEKQITCFRFSLCSLCVSVPLW